MTKPRSTKRIAVLGWGSLLWDNDAAGQEFDKQRGPWWCSGPTLKIEFSHKSVKRGGALTLVIDPRGTPTTVAWCVSKRSRMLDAVRDLAKREGTGENRIGRVDVAAMSSTDPVAAAVAVWARRKRRIGAVIWTGIEGEFERGTEPFPIQTAVGYLGNLREGRAKAAEYVRRTPEFVQTALRRAVEQEPWFHELAQAATGESVGKCRRRGTSANRTVPR